MISPDAPGMPIHLAIVVSRFNAEITNGLLRGARTYLREHGVDVSEGDIIAASGAFELPLIAQALARSRRYSGLICLGCVIKGDTAHFEFISLGASVGLMTAALTTGIPIAFGILTTYTEEQAQSRSCDDSLNKGREAAAACLETVLTLRRIQATSPVGSADHTSDVSAPASL